MSRLTVRRVLVAYQKTGFRYQACQDSEVGIYANGGPTYDVEELGSHVFRFRINTSIESDSKKFDRLGVTTASKPSSAESHPIAFHSAGFYVFQAQASAQGLSLLTRPHSTSHPSALRIRVILRCWLAGFDLSCFLFKTHVHASARSSQHFHRPRP